MKRNYLSIDIGGTNIKVAVIDRSGNIQELHSVTTPQNAEDFFLALHVEITQALESIRGIAISCPGKVDTASGVVSFGGSLPFLDGVSFKQLLKKYGLPVAIINDGKAAALAELWLGNLCDIQNGAAITLGTGIGGGVIVNGELIQGAHFQAGELSFMMRPSKSPSVNDMYGLTGSAVSLIMKVSDELGLKEQTDGKAVFEYINQKNPIAYPIFQEFCCEIAYLIINMQSVLDSKRIVIGGGISAQEIVIKEIKNQYQLLRQAIPLVENSIMPVEILPCRFRNEANLLGALYQLLIETDEKTMQKAM